MVNFSLPYNYSGGVRS